MTEETKDAIATASTPRGLATVALLKARFDEGIDHIEMFMPLVLDSVASLAVNSFTVEDVQDILKERHGLSIPQYTLTTLLKRAIKKGIIKRELSRYVRIREGLGTQDIQERKVRIENEHQRLAQEFRNYAAQRDFLIESDAKALELILTFLEEHKVAILLGAEHRLSKERTITQQASRAVAEFAQSILSDEPELARILQNILEGLVVYNTAFLRDISLTVRKFNNLRIFFDSNLLFQVLGLEGQAQEALARETLHLLKSAGAQCLAFDKTIHEMQAILRVHEDKLATTQGIKSLYPTPLTRYLIKNRLAPSDIRQISALLQRDLGNLGIQVVTMPRHIAKYTLDEKKLGELLADQRTGDVEQPRVVHDVDCTAAILTLRRGERSNLLEHVKAVFATTSSKVITNVRRWYGEEGESGISPVIHIRALSNLAWLRQPAVSINLKVHELVVLCHAALQPSRKTWERFLQHLNKLVLRQSSFGG